MRLLVAVLALLAVVGALPGMSGAQPRLGWYVTPSLTLSGRYDDNVFGTEGQDRQSDVIFELSPGIGLSYASPRLTVVGTVAGKGEVFLDHSDQDNFENFSSGFSVTYAPGPRLSLAVAGSFTYSVDPGRFAIVGPPLGAGLPTGVPDAPVAPTAPPTVATTGPTAAPTTFDTTSVPGVEVGRSRATAFAIVGSTAYQVDPRSSLFGSYGFTYTDVENRNSSSEHAVSVGFSRTLTPRHSLALAYSFSYFPEADEEGVFDPTTGTSTSSDSGSTSVHAAVLTWTGRLTEALTVSLGAGPQISGDGDVGVTGGASLGYQLQRLSLALGYNRSTTVVVGRSGPQDTDTVFASATYLLRRDLSIGAAASYSRVSAFEDASPGTGASTADTETYGISLRAAYQWNQYVSVGLGYTFTYQEGGGAAAIPHSQVLLSVNLAYPYRLR